jgi:hypothetical protein
MEEHMDQPEVKRSINDDEELPLLDEAWRTIPARC